ncbi:M48 family metallopeptidase [Trichlorobacter lovleyi]|uniref:M48 family metallopeptidase n=1 Tax=Trichlorobacter lovleyi TaxID=313985 RepID=UPI0022404F6D|nr:SprT family zinc-dependent metalloprotease [Trichlorobacter lovleyi]QOX79848.1 M48 family metallopeptidase [Trichlorobacter lovleyi]
MNTSSSKQLEVSDITFEVHRKPIKNLHIGVYPPDGRVRVSAPKRMSYEAIRLAVVGKLGWIRKHQQKFASQERQSPREYVTGETHYYQGKRYRLNVLLTDGRSSVHLRHGTIEMQVAPDGDHSYREALLSGWYRKQMKEQLPELLDKWQQIIGVQIDSFGIKRMKTRWGTCNPTAKRIWLNLELIKKPAHCLEYIIVHELMHLLEKHHNDRFKSLMDQYLPLWRQYREELNRQPLCSDEWVE